MNSPVSFMKAWGGVTGPRIRAAFSRTNVVCAGRAILLGSKEESLVIF